MHKGSLRKICEYFTFDTAPGSLDLSIAPALRLGLLMLKRPRALAQTFGTCKISEFHVGLLRKKQSSDKPFNQRRLSYNF